MTMKQTTKGQQLAATLRRLNNVGTRTRRYRGGLNVVERMLDDIRTATVYPGAFSGETHNALAGAWAVYNSWVKHIEGHRIDGVLWSKISRLSPWQTAKLLGDMVDAGVTNVFEGELFFQQLKLS